jgi:hypothetical protein
MPNPDIQSLEEQIFALTERLAELRAKEPGEQFSKLYFCNPRWQNHAARSVW